MAMLTQTLSLERGSNGAERCLRDPSFSSYLSGGNEEDCYELNLSKLSFEGLSDDDEIGVFSADKYFNDQKLDDEKPAAGVIKFPPVQNDSVLSCVKPKTLHQLGNTTSVSSWSSQSALLPVRNSLVNRASKLRGRRSYLGSFRCRCVCSDKNSVAVDEYQSCNEVLPTAAKEPVKRCVSTVTAESQCIMTKRETYSSTSKDLSVRDLPMIPRKSLEVFGSSIYKPYSFETTERKLTINWEDGLSRPAEILIPTVASGAYAESDSDASSDLFEIEDFTSKANPFLSRNMSGSATPTDAYAPSEASIEWSVVTASAADFPIITSDYDELKSAGKSIPYSKTAATGMNQKITATSDKPRRLSSSFLACNSQDSVKVVDHAHASPTYGKMPETKIRKSQEVPAKVFRPQTEEAKLTGFESAKNVRLGISSRSLAQSNSYHGYLQ